MKRHLLLISLLLLFLVACQQGEAEPEPTDIPATKISPPTDEPEPEPTEESEPEEQAATTTGAISDEELADLYEDLLSRSGSRTQDALVRIASSQDQRFTSVLIEMLRGSQLGIIFGPTDMYGETLERLTGQEYGANWGDWIEWYGTTDLEPPPGFTGFKGRMLSTIDEQFADFLNDDAPSNIRVEEIQWGGVIVDGIPALDNATMIEADKATYMNGEDAVFGISINGDARAYPLRILDWHEMANDVVGGVPVSLAYCTLCGAAIAFDGRASDGETYTFGSSGFLFRSNKLMYDRQTRTLWNQLTGEPVLGELVGTDVTLDLLPVVLTTWTEWQNQHPDTMVLDIETGFNRIYDPGAAYGDYFAYEDTMFPVWQRAEALPTKDQVYTLRIDGLPKAYPIEVLADEQVVNDTLSETNVVLVATRGIVSVDGENRRVGEVTYSAGSEVRAYDRGEHTFEPGPDANSVVDENGEVWEVTEEALISPAGERAERISGHLAYWFGWYAFFPQTLVYGE